MVINRSESRYELNRTETDLRGYSAVMVSQKNWWFSDDFDQIEPLPTLIFSQG